MKSKLEKFKGNFFLILVISVLILLVKPVFTQDNSNYKELAAQGTIRSCLKANWNSFSEEKGSKRINTIHLVGQCLSRSGCSCVKYQHPNGAVAADQEGNLDAAFCDETAYTGSNLDNVLGESDLLAKAEPEERVSRKSLAKTEAEKRAIDLRNRCQKAIREANDPVLGSIPVGPSKCRIIKNNLAKNTAPQSGNQVLGATSSDFIPYGPVDIIVEEETYKHAPVEFSAVGDIDPEITSDELGTGKDLAESNDNTQKLGIFKFFAQVFNVDIDNLKSNCAGITWDPYGRIFDAESLEPIAEVEVELIDATTKKLADMKFNLPYDFTGSDGLYNIQVEKEGQYALNVKPITEHDFISNPKLSPYWSKIYSDLYKPNDSFFEKQGVGTHHDIALQSKGKPYRGAVSVVVPGTLKSEEMNGQILFSGRVTFPMAKVCLFDEEAKKQVGQCDNANNIGRFMLAVNRTALPANKLLLITEKVDLNNPDLYKKEQPLETLNIYSSFFTKSKPKYYFEPILNYIEGYAYDSSGNVIPGAKIEVKLSVNNSLSYETKADDSGFFTIFSKNLPYLEFYLEFTDPKNGKLIKKTTSEFITDNKSYLTTEKINPVTGTKYGQPVIDPKTGKLNTIDKNYQLPMPTTPPEATKKSAFSGGIFLIVFILIALFSSLVGVVFYIKKSRIST